MEPTLIFHSGMELLEGPVFDRQNEYLYFVSILDCLVYCYNPGNHEILSVKLDSPVGCVYILGFKKILAASKNGFYEINFTTLEKSFRFQIGIDENVRYNDGIQDSIGRYIIGTMGYPEVQEEIGTVYSYHQGSFSALIERTTISNGLAFTSDSRVLYFIDTPTKKVAKYFYDISKGTVVFDSIVIEFVGDGSPDGMCIDQEGMLWIAEWGGSCISKWNPDTGRQLNKLYLPCINVTSCCFDHLGNLYVTTAKSELAEDHMGGSLYYFELIKNQTIEQD